MFSVKKTEIYSMGDAAILLCAGSGLRMRGEVVDKSLAPLRGKPAMLYSLEAFAKTENIKLAAIVTRDSEQRKKITDFIVQIQAKAEVDIIWVDGGKRRQDSVENALRKIPARIRNVFIHDCARPLIQSQTIRELTKIVNRDKGVCLAHRIVDTIKEVDGKSTDLRLLNLKDRDRSRLWGMETPQVFGRDLICAAYEQSQREGWEITDDASAFIRSGHRVSLLETPYPNPKLTVPEDIAIIEHLLAKIQIPYGLA